MNLDTDKSYTVYGMEGIAYSYIGPETAPDEDTEWSGYEAETGFVRMVMVGDDRVWTVDPEDVQEVPEDSYCHECGQVGCGVDTR